MILSPVAKMSKKRAERIYRNDVSNRNPWKEPTSSTKKPAPIVPTMAANVPAVFDNPVSTNTNLASWKLLVVV